MYNVGVIGATPGVGVRASAVAVSAALCVPVAFGVPEGIVVRVPGAIGVEVIIGVPVPGRGVIVAKRVRVAVGNGVGDAAGDGVGVGVLHEFTPVNGLVPIPSSTSS
jgi:hypothetical protein